MPGLIADVTLDYVYQGVHPLGEFGHCFVQPFQVPVAPFCVLLEPFQARVSPFGKPPSAFRELPDQCSQFREVTSQPRNLRVIPRNLRVIFGLAFEQELNSSIEFISSHQGTFLALPALASWAGRHAEASQRPRAEGIRRLAAPDFWLLTSRFCRLPSVLHGLPFSASTERAVRKIPSVITET